MLAKKGFKHSFTNKYSNVCSRSSDPLYIVSYYKNGSLLLGQTVNNTRVQYVQEILFIFKVKKRLTLISRGEGAKYDHNFSTGSWSQIQEQGGFPGLFKTLVHSPNSYIGNYIYIYIYIEENNQFWGW